MNTNFLDMIMSLSQSVDLVNNSVANHHKIVAYIASHIACELGLSAEEKNKIILASLVHDIGALSLQERLDTLDFEIQNVHKHSEIGYRLLRTFLPLNPIAPIVRYHHAFWDKSNLDDFTSEQIPFESEIIHLADRLSVLIHIKEELLSQRDGIIDAIEKQSGKMFNPELVSVLKKISGKEYFWFNIKSRSLEGLIRENSSLADNVIESGEILDLSKFFSKIIDFRSRFTATHSAGVAECCRILGSFLGFDKKNQENLLIAGYLHDLGKLAVPKEILEKDSELTDKEFFLVKVHPFYTYTVLSYFRNLREITKWASLHHEKLNGNGYPFHYEESEIPLGSRIVAVADIFTAIMEDRPYRKGMKNHEALQTLKELVEDNSLDSDVVKVLVDNFDEVNSLRSQAQEQARTEYETFFVK